MLSRIQSFVLVLFVGLGSIALPNLAQAQFIPTTDNEKDPGSSGLPDPLSLRAGWWDCLGLGTDQEATQLAAWRAQLKGVDRASLPKGAGVELDGLVKLIDDWSSLEVEELDAFSGKVTSIRELLRAVELASDVERQIKISVAELERLGSQTKQTNALQNEARDDYLNDKESEDASRKVQAWRWMRLWLRWKSLDRKKSVLEEKERALAKRKRLLSGHTERSLEEFKCDTAEQQYWRYKAKRSGWSPAGSPELGDVQSLPELRRAVYLQEQRLSALVSQLSLWICTSHSGDQHSDAGAPIGPEPKELQDWIADAQAQLALRRDEMASQGTTENSSDASKKSQALALDLRSIHELEGDLRQLHVAVEQYKVLYEGLLPSQGAVWTGVKSGWTNFIDGLDGLAHMSLFTINDYSIAPLDFVRFVLIILCAWLASRGLRSVVSRLEVSRGLRPSLVFLLRRLIHYTVIVTGLLIALSTMGIDLTKFAIFASAFGVGLGLGLQSLTKNFVAGFVVLFERSLKIGDFIELESGVRGSVREINLRGTVITTPDNIDIMIPNSEFVDGKVTNWTMRDKSCRLRIPFSVAYGTPKDRTKAAALAAANSLSFSILEPPRHPQVWLTQFGDSALCFELIVWVEGDAISRPAAVVAAYNWAIETSLAEAGIEIPFPQRDLHLRSYFGLRGHDALTALHGNLRSRAKSGGEAPIPTVAPSRRAGETLPTSENDAAQATLDGIAQVRREQEEAASEPGLENDMKEPE